MTAISAPSVTPHNFVLALQLISTGLSLQDASGATFVQLATQSGIISATPNAVQFGDYLVVAFGNQTPPNIFPTVSLLSSDLPARTPRSRSTARSRSRSRDM